jgi:hypothetical protein
MVIRVGSREAKKGTKLVKVDPAIRGADHHREDFPLWGEIAVY